jgi:tetratricopeptide (TPR) repeat protein
VQLLAVPGLSGQVVAAAFASNPALFMVAEAHTWHVCVYSPNTPRGAAVKRVTSVPAVKGARPLALSSQGITAQLESGHLMTQPLDELAQLTRPEVSSLPTEERDIKVRFVDSHSCAGHASGMLFKELCIADAEMLCMYIYCAQASLSSRARNWCRQALSRDDIQVAWEAASAIDQPDTWDLLGRAALSVLDTHTAVAAFRKAGNASMVLALDKILFLEDRHQLAGHALALVEHDYDAAEQMFLRAKDPVAALEMRKDLKHWGAAMRLAERADPDGLADLMSQHAAALELAGDAAAALAHFQGALAQRGGDAPQVQACCRAGAARCMVQAGDVRGGMRAAKALGRHDVLVDCAQMLRGHGAGGLALEAGELYEAAGEAQRACALYIEAKAFARAEPLLKGVKDSQLLLAVRSCNQHRA